MLVTWVETLYIGVFLFLFFCFFWGGGGVVVRGTPLYGLYGDVPLDRIWLFISLA